MGWLDQELDTIEDLCTLRKPAVLQDTWMNFADNLKRPSRDDSEVKWRLWHSVDDERPTNNSDGLQSQRSWSGLNVLEPVDDGGGVTRPKGFDADYAPLSNIIYWCSFFLDKW